MKHLLEIIKDNGYIPFRYSQTPPKNNLIFFSADFGFYFKDEYSETDFSTMRVGGLATFYIKDDDFDNPIIWGLSEHNKPPTLIFPRPIIISQVDEGVIFTRDDEINILLSKENHQTIFDNLFNKNKVYRFDLTKKPT